jgi:hypothetical protein
MGNRGERRRFFEGDGRKERKMGERVELAQKRKRLVVR